MLKIEFCCCCCFYLISSLTSVTLIKNQEISPLIPKCQKDHLSSGKRKKAFLQKEETKWALPFWESLFNI